MERRISEGSRPTSRQRSSSRERRLSSANIEIANRQQEIATKRTSRNAQVKEGLALKEVESILGQRSVFEGRAVEEVRFGPHAAVVPEVSGRAFDNAQRAAEQRKVRLLLTGHDANMPKSTQMTLADIGPVNKRRAVSNPPSGQVRGENIGR